MILPNNVSANLMLGGTAASNNPVIVSSGWSGMPCTPRPAVASNQSVSQNVLPLLGKTVGCCKWINMNGHATWVCAPWACEGGGTLTPGYGGSYLLGDNDPTTGMPYCDSLTTYDQAMYWIQNNPTYAAIAGAGLAFLLYKMFVK